MDYEQLAKHVIYYPDTGLFVWSKPVGRRIKPGVLAGDLGPDGYWRIGFGGTSCKAHRLAFFITEGRIPIGSIDHINGVKTDNRRCNLRECSTAENMQNQNARGYSKTGHIGVRWDEKYCHYKAHIKVNGKNIHLGTFHSLDEAVAARAAGQKQLYKFSPAPYSGASDHPIFT